MLEVSPEEILSILDTPLVVHKIAVILRFGTSYEKVDWLAKCLQNALEHLVQEHKDREMIQKALMGELKPKDEWELQQIGRQKDVRNKRMAIQLPPLHIALIEVRQELAKVTQESKDTIEVCKRAKKVSGQMHKEWSATKKANEELLTRLQEVEVKVKHVDKRLQVQESDRSHEPDRML